MKKIYIFLLLMSATCNPIWAFTIESTRFHCEKDTTEINQLLSEGIKANLTTPNDYMVFFAEKLLGTPYVANTLESDREYLTINIDELDCMTFVETLLALTRAAMEKSPSWYCFASHLETIRYRSGKLNGYASRLHYASAWIVENTARGHLSEITKNIPRYETQIKSLKFMSAHRDLYPALANDSTYNEIKNFESGYSMHAFPFVNKNNLVKKDVIAELQDGDIVCLTTKIEGLDVSHFGIILFKGQKPHLLHASSDKKKTILDKYDLAESLRNNRNVTGIRVLRAKAY